MLDTAAGVWLDRHGLVTASRGSKGHNEQDPSLELMRRCRHAAASVGVRIYIYGGLRGGNECHWHMQILDFSNDVYSSPFQNPLQLVNICTYLAECLI